MGLKLDKKYKVFEPGTLLGKAKEKRMSQVQKRYGIDQQGEAFLALIEVIKGEQDQSRISERKV